ncbi:exopolysaccharide Pel transporter PelG [Hoeflea sp. G2-23]|uniref:Exopolysaccharide Pel transporter PelG n=1 Tax=Hoeflea algicola TaxID=2983763 RepID=A0ABT3ZC64_9HYPH|nr:exopolysaccharide Pel transporter PelG [Hoeflea algicola]MCY0149394.1 exopolysaccharide Pel transporter PelG [Hoeflea algicola]
MAGIGFALQQLDRRGTALSGASALLGGAIATSGAWLVTVASLALLAIPASWFDSSDFLTSLRLSIVYAFMIAMVASAAPTLMATKRISDSLYSGKLEAVPFILLKSILWSAMTTLALSMVIWIIVIPQSLAMGAAYIATTLTVSIQWPLMVVCGSVMRFRPVILAYLAGGLVSVTGASIALVSDASLPLALLCFTGGQMVTVCILLERAMSIFPFPVSSTAYLRHRKSTKSGALALLGVAAAIGAAGLWVDRWVIWTSKFGTKTVEGLPNSALYDTPLFWAQLMLIPGLAAFLVHLETGLVRNLRQFVASILSHATLAEIDQLGETLAEQVHRRLGIIFRAETVLCLAVAICAPLFAEQLGMTYRQISVYRIALAGVACHFVFIACSGIVLMIDRRLEFAILQGIFLVANGVSAAAVVLFGERFLGTNYLVAASISALIAWWAMQRALTDVTYHTFMDAVFRPSEEQSDQSEQSVSQRGALAARMPNET